MPPPLLYVSEPWSAACDGIDDIIDVRSPGEFAEDRIPGAVNLPALDDAERAEVGTTYKQISPFVARKQGAALVCANVARHLQDFFAGKDKGYRPLLYCWRGGQRSHSFATILQAIGWQVTLLKGGYKTYRTLVRAYLQQRPPQFQWQVLGGETGAGKTQILRRMKQRGLQVLDLEDLAGHRGSLLGQGWQGKPTAQPAQKYFESLLADVLRSFDAKQPVWVESESNKIGRLHLPPALWQAMKQAPAIAVSLPIEARVEALLQAYPHFVEHRALLKEKLLALKERHGSRTLQHWYDEIDRGNLSAFVRDILIDHYDPAYRRSLSKHYPNLKQILSLPDLSEASVDAAIDTLGTSVLSS